MASGSSPAGDPKQRTSVWLDARPGPRRATRGGQDQPAGLDLERITAATVALLDAEGLAKFSMRRLAGELGVTAMSLYWYVNSKDDLLELAMDAVQAELSLPADASDRADEAGDWREEVRQLAAEYRRMFVTHPWISLTFGQYMNVGPGAMRFARSAQQVMRRAGLAPDRLTGALSAVFQFAYGFATVEANWNARCAAAGLTSDELYAQVLGKAAGRPEYAGSLELREAADPGATVERMRQHDFDTALELLIAGIEAMRDDTAGTG